MGQSEEEGLQSRHGAGVQVCVQLGDRGGLTPEGATGPPEPCDRRPKVHAASRSQGAQRLHVVSGSVINKLNVRQNTGKIVF